MISLPKKICEFLSVRKSTLYQCLYHFHTTTQDYKSFGDWYRSLWIPKLSPPPYEHIIQIGDPVLRQKSDPVPLDSLTCPEIKLLVKIMISVLKKYDCMGLAAPQIGIPLRVIVMEFNDSLKKRYPPDVYRNRQMETLPLTVIINPTCKVTKFNKTLFVEHCGSVRGYSGDVSRYESIDLTGFDEHGQQKEIKLTGWNARIAQHEIDHLDGIIYTDIMDRKTFTCTCWEAVNRKHGRITLPFHHS